MSNKRHILIIDPTAFSGGSKVATENILRLLNKDDCRISVLTAHKDSWKYSFLTKIQLFQSNWLSEKETGIPYFLRHIIISLNIILLHLRFGKIDYAVGASGPGVDLSLYFAKPILKYKVIQLVHGPVAMSKTIARGLKMADEVFYLKSTKPSLLSALSNANNTDVKVLPSNFDLMKNGLPKQSWPRPCQRDTPVIFWAASLLKWKGLDILVDALLNIPAIDRPETHICYIQPKDIKEAVSSIPFNTHAIHCYENPKNIDEIRASSSIFISTSTDEPFGLSILEAMAAGHCVLIPSDGAYWDTVLQDDIDCIKYEPNDSNNLSDKILALKEDMKKIIRIGQASAQVALGYQAEKQYENIKNTLGKKDSIQ